MIESKLPAEELLDKVEKAMADAIRDLNDSNTNILDSLRETHEYLSRNIKDMNLLTVKSSCRCSSMESRSRGIKCPVHNM